MGSEIEQLKAMVGKLQAEVTRLSGMCLVSYRLASCGLLREHQIRRTFASFSTLTGIISTSVCTKRLVERTCYLTGSSS